MPIKYNIITNPSFFCREDIYRFWYEVYFEEMNRDEVYANHKEKKIVDSLEPFSSIITLHHEGFLIGCMRMIQPKYIPISHYYRFIFEINNEKNKNSIIGTKFMIHKKYRHKGFSRKILDYAKIFSKKIGMEKMFIDCNDHLVNMFKNNNFKIEKHNIKSKDYGDVFIMSSNLLNENVERLYENIEIKI